MISSIILTIILAFFTFIEILLFLLSIIILLSPFIISAAILMVGLLIVLMVTKPQRKRAKVNKKKKRLYDACKEKGITEVSSAEQVQRAQIVAKRYKFNFSDEEIRALFDERKQAEREEKIAKENAEKKKRFYKHRNDVDKKEDEKKQLLFFFDSKPRLKRQILMNNYRQSLVKSYRTCEKLMAGPPMESKQNWAMWGGIADGIAGPGAGVAVASDVQRENQATEARNLQRMIEHKKIEPYIYKEFNKIDRQLSFVNKLYNQFQLDIIDEQATSKDLFDRLLIDYNYDIDEYNVITVKVVAWVKEKYRILDSTDITVDGLLSARVVSGDKCIGYTTLILPIDGIYQTPEEIQSTMMIGKIILPETFDKKSEYRVEIVFKKLWAIEFFDFSEFAKDERKKILEPYDFWADNNFRKTFQ